MLKHTARKRFGQNFLRDSHIVSKMIDSIHPRPGEHLVEIGPGQGALTLPLLERAQTLMAIEIDRDLIEPLRQRAQSVGSLQLHVADALAFDLSTLIAPGESLRLVGNLPYNISTPLLFHCLEYADRIVDCHFMLQQEVVERMAAPPNSKVYGRLSVMLQYHCEVIPLFLIPPSAFTPEPAVMSQWVRLIPHHPKPLVAQDYGLFARVVSQAFTGRRKMIRNTLKGLMTAPELETLGLEPTSRPETLSVADYISISNYLSKYGRIDSEKGG
jgi:16S rRNA (adenine1518-N6/adenine1519-N6)-dimethyltransferase